MDKNAAVLKSSSKLYLDQTILFMTVLRPASPCTRSLVMLQRE